MILKSQKPTCVPTAHAYGPGLTTKLVANIKFIASNKTRVRVNIRDRVSVSVRVRVRVDQTLKDNQVGHKAHS